MNDCPRAEIRDLLPDLVHDQLDAELRAEVERHVAGCADCAAEVELLGAMRTMMSRNTPSIDTARVAAAVSSARNRDAGARPSWARRHAALMAAAVVMFAAVLIALGALRQQRRIAQATATIVDSVSRMLARDSLLAGRNVTPAPPSAATRESALVATADSVRTQRPRPVQTGEPQMANAELSFGGGFQDLSDSELDALLQNVNELKGTKALPAADPDPVLPALSESGTAGLER